MGMNKAKGNMYGFCTHTWNPIRGKCLHDCSYCYIKLGGPMGWSHEAKLIEREVDLKTGTKLGKDNFIFVGSSTDMWGQWVRESDIFTVLAYCRRFDNRYLFQSKNPERFASFASFLPERSWLCTTIETNRNMSDISTAPSAHARAIAMARMKKAGYKTTLTIEPVMDFDLEPMINIVRSIQPDWVSIGADSKQADLPEPDVPKVRSLIDGLSAKGFEVKIKKNFKRLLYKGNGKS